MILVRGLPHDSAWAHWYRDESNREFVTPNIQA